jgi:nucleotide-binding universal stress UspA family protein
LGIVVIKKVLVAVDGSENSDRALDFALDLAEKYTAGVTVLNVSESPAIGTVTLEPTEPTAYAGVTVNFYKDLQRFHEEILRKAVNRAREFKPNVTVLSKLREGNAASEIVAEAKEGGFDIIVVGHKGLGRVKELFLGNISEKVAHLAPCPVMIVR